MAAPFINAIIAGSAGKSWQVDVTTVTVATLISGKVPTGYGYSDGTTGVPVGGSLSDSSIGTATIHVAYTPLGGLSWVLAMSDQGQVKGDILKVIAVDGSGSHEMAVDANTSFANSAGVASWSWNSTDHDIPDWSASTGIDRDFTTYFNNF